MTDYKAKQIGLKAGYASMRAAKRKRWNVNDACAAIVGYRIARGFPSVSPVEANAILEGLTATQSLVIPESRRTSTPKGKRQ